MVLDDVTERPQRADDRAVDVTDPPGGVSLDALPVGPVIHAIFPDDLLHTPAQVSGEPRTETDALMRCRRPLQTSAEKGGEGIGRVAVMTKRFEQREEELLRGI